MPKKHYNEPKDIHLQTHKKDQWNKLICWIYGQLGHTSNRCPLSEESKRNRGKKSFEAAKKKRTVKIEGMVPTLCYKCVSKNHKCDNCPKISFREHIQQQQLCSTSESSESYSS